jgi:hypothetical protein
MNIHAFTHTFCKISKTNFYLLCLFLRSAYNTNRKDHTHITFLVNSNNSTTLNLLIQFLSQLVLQSQESSWETIHSTPPPILPRSPPRASLPSSKHSKSDSCGLVPTLNWRPFGAVMEREKVDGSWRGRIQIGGDGGLGCICCGWGYGPIARRCG